MIKQENLNQNLSIESLKAGNHDEFNKLVDAYYAVLYRLIIKIVKNVEDAEDLLQEVFIKITKNIKKFEGRSSLSTWIYKIGVNEALMFLRKKKLLEFSLDVDTDKDDQVIIGDGKQIKDWCCIPEKELLTSESITYLNNAIDELSLNLKLVFILRDINGLSIRDTAEALDVSESVVKTRLFRARNVLRQELNEYFSQKV